MEITGKIVYEKLLNLRKEMKKHKFCENIQDLRTEFSRYYYQLWKNKKEYNNFVNLIYGKE